MYIANVTYKDLINNHVKQTTIHNVFGIFDFENCLRLEYKHNGYDFCKEFWKYDTLVLRVVLTYNE